MATAPFRERHPQEPISTNISLISTIGLLLTPYLKLLDLLPFNVDELQTVMLNSYDLTLLLPLALIPQKVDQTTSLRRELRVLLLRAVIPHKSPLD